MPSKTLGFLTEHHKSNLSTLIHLSPHHLGFQGLKGPLASLGLQVSLDHMEIKESPEIQDHFTSLDFQVRKEASPPCFSFCVSVCIWIVIATYQLQEVRIQLQNDSI